MSPIRPSINQISSPMFYDIDMFQDYGIFRSVTNEISLNSHLQLRCLTRITDIHVP